MVNWRNEILIIILTFPSIYISCSSVSITFRNFIPSSRVSHLALKVISFDGNFSRTTFSIKICFSTSLDVLEHLQIKVYLTKKK